MTKFTIAALTIAVSMFAHHSVWGIYDVNQPITLSGTISRCELTNPHWHCFLEVKDKERNIVQWELEMGSGVAMARRGIGRIGPNALREGLAVTVDAFRAKNSEPRATAWRFTFKDGHSVITADGWGFCVSSEDIAEPRTASDGSCPKQP